MTMIFTFKKYINLFLYIKKFEFKIFFYLICFDTNRLKLKNLKKKNNIFYFDESIFVNHFLYTSIRNYLLVYKIFRSGGNFYFKN